MARYNETEKTVQTILERFRIYHDIPCDSDDRRVQEIIRKVIEVIREQPTADVAPRVEVDKDIKVLTKEVAKRKAMLLDAIDNFRNLLCIESFVDYEDTRKHYVVNLDDVDRIHDELKKKYTEGGSGNET